MQVKKLVDTKISVVDDILCNKCGESLKIHIGEQAQFEGLEHASFQSGYFSKEFNDCDEHEFSLCEKCCKWLFSTFKISPTKEGF